MAVANFKSTAITNADATPVVATSRALTKGTVYRALATLSVAAADDDGSIYRAVRIPSNAIITSIKILNTAITAGTAYDIGLYAVTVNGGAAKDADVFASDVDMSSARTTAWFETRFEAAALTTLEQQAYQLAGDSVDPISEYDICVTADTVGSAAGTIIMQVDYTV